VDYLSNTLLDTVGFRPLSIKAPSGWLGHIRFANWIIRVLEPKIFVELGTHSGNSYFAFCQSVKEFNIPTKCYAVDTWEGDEHSGVYSNDVFEYVHSHNIENYAQFSKLLRMRFDDAVNYFTDKSVDLLHIDGLHTYEAVKHDFETWLPKLSECAVVIIHDTNIRERGFGVWQLWEELKKRYPNNIEFLHSNGLGVLQVGVDSAVKKKSFLNLSLDDKQRIKIFFASLGEDQLKAFDFEVLDRHVCNLNQQLIDRDKHIDNLNQELINRDSYISDQSRALNDKETHIVNLEAIITSLRSELDSTLIKLFRKNILRFRWCSSKVGQVLNLLKVTSAIVRKNGGIVGVIHKVIKISRRDGWRGIKDRLRKVIMQPFDQLPAVGDYSEWLSRYGIIDDRKREVIKRRILTLSKAPLISVLMPVYNPPIDMLEEAIKSVQQQLYQNWELCIADDASTDMRVSSLLQSYAELDCRIKVVLRKNNGHISAASNSALEIANGEFVALLDHDDLLSEDALFWVIDAITSNPNAGLIYSDEDKIDEFGKRYDPYFKSDWNPDLFLSHNMICHLGVYRTHLVRQLGGFRKGFEGAQDYDLALRCVEQLKSDQIIHIPRVIYHWRAHAESTAKAFEVKDYALSAGELALNDHFVRTGVSAKAETLSFGMYRARYEIPVCQPLVSLIIPTRNKLNLIKQCIESIVEKTTYKNYEILIVDNNSNDPEVLEYFSNLTEDLRIRIVRDDRPFNYSALNNSAVLQARGEYIGLINNDIEVISSEWLEEMISFAIQPNVGAVGARLWYPNERLQHGGCITGIGGVAGHSHKNIARGDFGYFSRAQLIQTLSALTAACLIIKKNIYQEVGGLDEVNLKVAFNDIDFCLRVREAGYRNIWTPYAELYHHESATRGYEDTQEKKLRFMKEVLYMKTRWKHVLNYDPAYSPNLTLDREDFSYAWPPRVNLI